MLRMGIQMPPCSHNFQHRSVARSNKRHATPSYKIEAGCGNRTPIARVSTRGRNHLTTVVNPCWSWYVFGYSYPRHHTALSQYCDSSVFLKLSQYCDSSVVLIYARDSSVSFRIRDVSATRRDSSVQRLIPICLMRSASNPT